MSSYCVADIRTPSFLGSPGVTTTQNSFVRLISIRKYGELQSAASTFENTIQKNTGSTTSGMVQSGAKCNTRSPDPSAMFDFAAADGVLHTLISIGHNDISYFSFVFSKRYTPVATESGDAIGFTPVAFANNSQATLFAYDPAHEQDRAVRRRPTRRGWWTLLGNDNVTMHQKTGTGAFLIMAPHFANDVTWADVFSWRLGRPGETINLGLFPPPPPVTTKPERTLLGVGT